MEITYWESKCRLCSPLHSKNIYVFRWQESRGGHGHRVNRNKGSVGLWILAVAPSSPVWSNLVMARQSKKHKQQKCKPVETIWPGCVLRHQQSSDLERPLTNEVCREAGRTPRWSLSSFPCVWPGRDQTPLSQATCVFLLSAPPGNHPSQHWPSCCACCWWNRSGPSPDTRSPTTTAAASKCGNL